MGLSDPRVSAKEEPGAGGTRRVKGSSGDGGWRGGEGIVQVSSAPTSPLPPVPELPPLLSPPYFLPHAWSVLFVTVSPAPQAPPSSPVALNQCSWDKFLLRGKWSLEVGSKIELPRCVTLSKSLEPLSLSFSTCKMHALYHNDRANLTGVLNKGEVSVACSACPSSWGGVEWASR